MCLLFSRWQHHAKTITKYLQKKMKPPENSLQYVLRLTWNASTWQELDDQIYCGQYKLWHDQ